MFISNQTAHPSNNFTPANPIPNLRHAVVPDPHSPNVSSIHPWWKKEFQEIWNLTESAGVRVIAPTYDPICLMSYGVTRMGAMRLL